LRLCGYSDWSSDRIDVYLDDATAANPDQHKKDRLHTSLVEHLGALVIHVFLHCRPAKPSQSRWTGVGNVAQWALSLAMFHRMLAPVFMALSENSKDDMENLDADAQCSAILAATKKMHWVQSETFCQIMRSCPVRLCYVTLGSSHAFSKVQVADSNAFRIQQSKRRFLLGQWCSPQTQKPEAKAKLSQTVTDCEHVLLFICY
jgi:hypothetical protein